MSDPPSCPSCPSCSNPSYPSYPSCPSNPSYPSYPSYPSNPSYPSCPSYPSFRWVGADQTVLVSLNPFRRLPIYGADALAENAAPAPNTVRKPHTFAIASAAYGAMGAERRNMSILISGESGAGKTEATKQCLNFLADVAGSSSGVEQRVLRANPILEAFGNAKTSRNDNSSRFGRCGEVVEVGRRKTRSWGRREAGSQMSWRQDLS